MPWCSRATTTNVSRTRRRRPRIGEGRRARGRHRNTVAAFFMSRRNARNTDRTTMESERKRSRRTRTAPPRCTPAGAGRYRVGAHRDVEHAPARQTPAAIGHAGYSHPVITSSATRTSTSLRKQLVDRRRVVHGIAIGREQIEHGGHPLDDTGTIVSIHMTLLLIAENNLYGRDGIRAVSDLQQMSSVPFVAKETRDSRNADGITASDDRCKPV